MWISTATFRPRRGLPNRIELWIVERQARAVSLPRGQSEALHDLAEADGAGFDVGLELLRGALTEARTDVLERDVREHHHAVLVWAVPDGLDAANQTIPRGTAGVDQHPEIQRIHRGHERLEVGVEIGAGWWLWMSITGYLARGTGMLRHDQRRARLVVADTRGRETPARGSRRGAAGARRRSVLLEAPVRCQTPTTAAPSADRSRLCVHAAR